ncbi:uncharacterized protein V1516DRAFT_678726 [Lipomyces oligophaga]|uniref:uncharacterized protein n=1 Tax=Lipomyces oligophaga TaxID=45792 RepID=UPI0034CFB84C
MVKLKEIPRTATFAWSPGQLPILATGTVAGAVDADFSSTSSLELWDLNLVDKSSTGVQLQKPLVSVNMDVRFHDLAWGGVSSSRPAGVLAAAQENAVLTLWDPDGLQQGTTEPFFKGTSHTAAIKSLDFNPCQNNLLATAGAKGEVFIWDLDKPATPMKPGTSSSRHDEIESVAWNNNVAHIMATAGNTGFTSVWDLKNKREVLHLFYPGPGGGGRRGVSSVVWHPENSTKLITALEDDSSPVILMWDLRNANAPEKVLSGHSQGVLSLAWCKRDPDLLLSSGKDNRSLLWNPQSGELLGEFPIATNWTFETRWYGRNPELFASASFDGKITVQSLQSIKKSEAESITPKPEGNDFWNSQSYVDNQQPSFSLKQPPKWLRRPVGASFGFGGKVVSIRLDSSTSQSSVKIQKIVIEPGLASETEQFQEKLNSQNLSAIAESRSEEPLSEKDRYDWKILLSLYDQSPKQRLIESLGYSQEELETLFKKFESLAVNGSGNEEDMPTDAPVGKDTADSLFNDSAVGDQFLSSITPQVDAIPDVIVPSGSFTIFDKDTTDADKLIAQAVVLGKFSEAVEISLKEDRMSDAFMLALSGDDECRAKVQKAYFEKYLNGPSYIRLLASIANKNFTDIVKNADINNWKEIVVALCTFTSDGEFSKLIAELGDRLNEVRKAAKSEDALELRKSAALCYLVGAKLEQVVGIWLEELAGKEKDALSMASPTDSPFKIHIKCLQEFVEKVTVFRNAVKYTDDGEKKSGAEDYNLAELYEVYREYANVVASQGFLDLAHKYLMLLPTQYPSAELEKERIRKATTAQILATGSATLPIANSYGASRSVNKRASLYTPYAPVTESLPSAAPISPYAPVQLSGDSSYVPSGNMYQPPSAAAPSTTTAAPVPLSTYEQPKASPYGHGYSTSLSIPAPPPPVVDPPNLHHDQPPIGPPPVTSHQSGTKNVGGWNDAPLLKSANRKQTTPAPVQPILSPFPGQTAPAPTGYAPPTGSTPPAGALPSYGRSSVIAPPPTNAKPPQSVISTPVQSPPPTTARVNPYAPSVEFVNSVGQQAVPPPGIGTSLPPNGPPSVGSTYAAPTQTSRPVNPYAPQPATTTNSTNRPINPYAPVAAPVLPTGQAVPGPPPMTAPPLSGLPPMTGPPSVTAGYALPPQAQHVPRPPSVARTVSPAQSIVAASMSGRSTAAAPPPPKYAPGDRSHIPANAQPIYGILSAEMARVKQKVPANVAPQVHDTEKRLNILFDHLNNSELLTEETIREMVILAQALQNKDFDTAYAVHLNLWTTRMDECGQWMVGIRRLIEMLRHTSM